MQILLKKLYVRRMAADLGINKIYTYGKMVIMRTNMSKKVFKIMTESMTSDIHHNCLVFTGKEIKVCKKLPSFLCSLFNSYCMMVQNFKYFVCGLKPFALKRLSFFRISAV